MLVGRVTSSGIRLGGPSFCDRFEQTQSIFSGSPRRTSSTFVPRIRRKSESTRIPQGAQLFRKTSSSPKTSRNLSSPVMKAQGAWTALRALRKHAAVATRHEAHQQRRGRFPAKTSRHLSYVEIGLRTSYALRPVSAGRAPELAAQEESLRPPQRANSQRPNFET